MTWISGIQRVLDYIEENLDGDICYDEMTKLSGSGAYHLQRSFSLLTGMTLTEYIRQRRLTLAAGDLIRGMLPDFMESCQVRYVIARHG